MSEGGLGLVGYDDCLTSSRSRVRFSEPVLVIEPTASLAQLGERQTEDLKVPGSIPGGGNQARLAQSVEHWSNKPTVAGSIPVVSIIRQQWDLNPRGHSPCDF